MPTFEDAETKSRRHVEIR